MMYTDDDENVPTRPATRTCTVIVFLTTFAITASWLVVYAVPNALIGADLLSPWPTDHDPRPTWMLKSFFGVFMTFAVVGVLFRWSSWRQLRRIDAIADAED